MCWEASREEVALICSSLVTCEILVHPENYPEKLPAVRKVCKMLAMELGMTRTDLKPVLAAKLEEFQSSQSKDPDSE